MALALRTNSNDPELADRIVKAARKVGVTRSRLRAGSEVEQGLVAALDKRSTTASAVEERVSRELGEHPQNPRALFGLWQSFDARRDPTATRTRKRFDEHGMTRMSCLEHIRIYADDAIIAHRQTLPTTLREMRPA